MAMLSSFDPFFRDFDRWSDNLLNRRVPAGPRLMTADAYRHGDHFVVRFDLPGVDPASIDVTVEKNVLSVGAARSWTPGEEDQVVLAERPQGHFERKLYLGDNLDTDHIEANYDHGVITLRIPVSEQAKARKVEVTSGERPDALVANSSSN
jgi:HSP20 family protein